MAQLNQEQKKWVDRFLERPDGIGRTDNAFPETPGLGGLDTGQVHAITPGQVIGPATTVAKKVWSWINEQGVTTIIIENRSSKVLILHEDKSLQKLHNKKDAKWGRMAPPKIAAKSKDKLTVHTDKRWRGKTTATTSGEVVYEVEGEKKSIVRIVWMRKGNGIVAQSDSWSTESGRYTLTGHQSEDGEFTFWFEEVAQQTNPQNPKPTKDSKEDTKDSKEEKPESGGDKETKPAPPAETHVLFKQGKFDLSSEARSRLHDFAMAYRASKSTAIIDLDGFASKEGVEESNKTLSFDRAEAVFNHLVEKEKLPGDKIQFDGHGVTSQFDPKKLEPNRRVTIKLK